MSKVVDYNSRAFYRHSRDGILLLSTVPDYDDNVADNDDVADDDDNDDDDYADDASIFRQPLPSRQGLLRPSPLPRPSW